MTGLKLDKEHDTNRTVTRHTWLQHTRSTPDGHSRFTYWTLYRRDKYTRRTTQHAAT